MTRLHLDKLDKYVENVLIPTYTCGKERRKNHVYHALMSQAHKKRKKGKPDEAAALTKQAQHLPTIDPNDPNYRRLHYIRYVVNSAKSAQILR
jgi:hypothetical protein